MGFAAKRPQRLFIESGINEYTIKMKNKPEPPVNPFDNEEFRVRAEKAQPLMVLEYLNSWGNEFLFIFLLMASAFLLLLVNQFSASMPETVPTIVGVDVPAYLGTQVPIFVLIIVAIALAVYYNMRRRYVENMMYFFYQKMAEREFDKKPEKSPKQPKSKK
jgi:hypothetical protein